MTLMPEYRAQLYAAAGSRARRRRPTLTRWWPVAASTAVVVVVAAAAVTMLSHHRHPSSAPTPTPSAVPAGPLTDMLGVLRRTQTQADLQTWVPGFFATFASPMCRAASTPFQCTLRLDRPLIREVTVLGTGYRVALLPYTSKGRIAGVAVTLRGPGINYLAAGPWFDSTTIPPGLTALRTRGLLLPAYVSDGVDRGALVVPDGVARVVLGPVRLTDRSVSRRLAPTAGASAVVYDNVAVFQLNGLTARNLELRPGALRHFFTQGSGPLCRLTFALYRLPAETPMVWLAADGKVVNRVQLSFYVYVGMHDPEPGSTPFAPGCGASG